MTGWTKFIKTMESLYIKRVKEITKQLEELDETSGHICEVNREGQKREDV